MVILADNNRVNFVGDIETTHPADVKQSMQALLVYASQPKTLGILLAFHAKYEKIHPFQGGNGRTGRIILFKECLKHRIMPVIYTESVQRSYKEALNHAQKTSDFNSLIQISKQAQEIYHKELQLFLYDYSQSNKTEQWQCSALGLLSGIGTIKKNTLN